MTNTETDLDGREATIPPKDINGEIVFCKDRLNEMCKLRNSLDVVRDNVDPLCDSITDQKCAVDLKEDIRELERQWDRLELRLNNRLNAMEVRVDIFFIPLYFCIITSTGTHMSYCDLRLWFKYSLL